VGPDSVWEADRPDYTGFKPFIGASGVAMKRSLPFLMLLTMVAVGAACGLLPGTFFGLADLAFRLAPRPASAALVIVAIDRESLRRLGPWPWPRRHHAAVLDRLSAADARQVAFDIDFSARTGAGDDQALADAIGRAAGRVVLPVFRQNQAGSGGQDRHIRKLPYAPFSLGTRLGSVTIGLAADGRARRYPGNGGTVPGLAPLLAGGRAVRAGSFFLDYGIRPDTVPRLSYADVLAGHFPAEAVRGRTILVGATAPELGDRVPVPVHGVLAGPVVHALAFESLVQGRDIYAWTALSIVIAAFVLCFVAGRRLERVSRRAIIASCPPCTFPSPSTATTGTFRFSTAP